MEVLHPKNKTSNGAGVASFLRYFEKNLKIINRPGILKIKQINHLIESMNFTTLMV
jgi:hypothetical protein